MLQEAAAAGNWQPCCVRRIQPAWVNAIQAPPSLLPKPRSSPATALAARRRHEPCQEVPRRPRRPAAFDRVKLYGAAAAALAVVQWHLYGVEEPLVPLAVHDVRQAAEGGQDCGGRRKDRDERGIRKGEGRTLFRLGRKKRFACRSMH